jgi:hypothetical protein
MLTQQDIDKFRARFKCKQDIFDYALEINKEIADDYDNNVINLYAQGEALKLHMYLFGNTPADTFREYVDYVHQKLDRPNFLCGMPGVNYTSEEITA